MARFPSDRKRHSPFVWGCALAGILILSIPQAGIAASGGGGHGVGGFGGNSAAHISSQGAANTNGPDSSDRDTGLDRAKDRMSKQGLKHNKAHENK